MNDIIVFGKKEEFAIQLGIHPNKEKCKLCFWAKGRKMGTFTKGGDLNDSIDTYYKFSENKENYYLPILEGMNASQIIKFFIEDVLLSISSASEEKFKELNKRIELCLSFGSQFTNDSSDMIFLSKGEKVIIIYKREQKNAVEFVISFNTLSEVFEEYITYCSTNGLV